PSSVRTTKTPNASLKRLSTVPTRKSDGKPALKVWGGSKSTLGKRKRVVAIAPAPHAAAKVVQATPMTDRKPRRDIGGVGAAAEDGRAPPAGAGLAGAAGTVGAAAGGAACVLG